MKFWDTSAIIPLFINEELTSTAKSYLEQDKQMMIWWGTSIEVYSTVSRLEREGVLSEQEQESVISCFRELEETSIEIHPQDSIKKTAKRLVRNHAIKTLDALQLASCIFANNEFTVKMVTFDERLRRIAQKEGISVLS